MLLELVRPVMLNGNFSGIIMYRSSIFPPLVMKWAIRTLFVSNSSQRICAQVAEGNQSVVSVRDSDALDNFIDNLMIEKMNKWKSINESKRKGDVEVPQSNNVIQTGEVPGFAYSSEDDYVCEHLASPQLHSILNDCRSKEVRLSPETLVKAACVLAKAGNKAGVEAVISLADVGDSCDEKCKEELKVFKAEAMWRGGESVQKSIDILHKVYRTQPAVRRFVRTSLKSLIREVILCRGEASLVQVKNLVLELADPPFEDAVPLSFLWGQCILSEWFADQQISVELANIGRDNPKFKKAIENRIDTVVGQALAKHQEEAVYRVLETLLKLCLYKAAQSVLGNLFDYKYIIGDKRGCEAILEMCASTDLDIGSTRRKQFENAPALWVNRRNTMVPHKILAKFQNSPEILRVPKFKFKL